MIDWDQHARDHFGKFPHPSEPSLTVDEFPQAVKLATATKFGDKDPKKGHASPKEAAAFWREFKPTGLSPDTYMQLLHTMAPMSFRYHGRAPTMREIVMHQESKPKEMRDYYSNLPHELYPEMTAQQWIETATKAKHYSMKHLGRDPYPHEVQFFQHGGHNLQGIEQHYLDRKEPGGNSER